MGRRKRRIPTEVFSFETRAEERERGRMHRKYPSSKTLGYKKNVFRRRKK